MVKLGEVLTERRETPSEEDLLSERVRIIEKISFDTGRIQLRSSGSTRTGMILVRPGDLVVSGINVAKGAIAIYDPDSTEPVAATIHYAACIPNPVRVDIRFLWWMLRSRFEDPVFRCEVAPSGVVPDRSSVREMRRVSCREAIHPDRGSMGSDSAVTQPTTRQSLRAAAGIVTACLLLVCAAVPGCGRPATPQQDVDAAVRERVAEWMQLAETPDESLETTRPVEIMFELLALRPDAFLPIFDVFANPDTPPKVRLLAHESLKSVLAADAEGVLLIPALLPLVEPRHDPMIRACAMDLLALAESPGLAATFQAYLDDADSRVRTAALCGRARLGDADARETLTTLYIEEKAGRFERDRIVLELSQKPADTDLPLLEKAVGDAGLPPSIRVMAIAALGHIGGTAQLPALEGCASDPNTSENVRGAAQGAIDAIRSRAQPPPQDAGAGSPE